MPIAIAPVETPPTRPEVALLLLSARTRFDADADRRTRKILEGRLDWNFVLQQASFHGIIPLMYLNLSRFSPDALPKSILEQLKNAYNSIARLNLSLTRDLIQLIKTLSDAGIRAIPCKGPVLAATGYGNLSLRHFSDLDIFLGRKDILKAKQVLAQQGYRPNLQFTAKQETAYFKTHHEYRFVREKDAAIVEIQWAITEETFSFPFDFDEVWERREMVVLAGTSVSSLHPDDLLLILCVHGTKHRWEQLKWICDIAEIVMSYQGRIDWVRLAAHARAQGGARMLYLGLYLARQMFGAILPSEVLEPLRRDSQIKSLATHVAVRLSKVSANPARLRDEPVFFYWKARERLRDKLPLVWKFFPEYLQRMVLPNEKDFEFLRLPAIFSASYYIVRPFRLVWEYSLSFLHRNRRMLSWLLAVFNLA
jgi:hypothetical protein